MKEYLIGDKVIPYYGGRQSSDTNTWRDATSIELEQQKYITELEAKIARIEEIIND